MSAPLVLRGVDLAAFAAALAARLRSVGVPVSADGQATFVQALRRLAPHTTSGLYWAARLTLVNGVEDIGPFDALFAAVFGAAEPDAMPGSIATLAHPSPETAAAGTVRRAGERAGSGGLLPWATRVVTEHDDSADAVVPDVLPSRIAALADQPFDSFDAQDLRLLGSWLETTEARWPLRRSLRFEPHAGGKRIDLRATMNASRKTGWEAVLLARTRPRRRPRRVVLVCDVSRSMQPYAAVYLHLMRALARRTPRRVGIRPEVYAFSTSLTRLTAVLSHRSPEVALQRANAKVADRYGGTFVGRSVAALLAAPHGNALRSAVVIIASDGWDADPPEVLAAAMARLRRRATSLVWVNPRAGRSDFQPLAGSMSAALPYCDLLLPAHSLTGLRELLLALGAMG